MTLVSSSYLHRRCAVCGGLLRIGYARCYCCMTLVRQLGQPLAPVEAVVEYRVGDGMHRRLRGYKDAPVVEVRRARVDELAAMAGLWLSGHHDRLVDRFGGTWDAVATVPSSCRPGSPVDVVVDGSPISGTATFPCWGGDPTPSTTWWRRRGGSY